MDETVTYVGAFEAKTHLSAILDAVEKGREYIITRHGHPVARLLPQAKRDIARIDASIEKLLHMRKGNTLGGLSWKELRDEGRRF